MRPPFRARARRALRLGLAGLLALALAAALVVVGAFVGLGVADTAAGLSAKAVCSGLHVAGRRLEDVLEADLAPASPLLRWVSVTADPDRPSVRARLWWSRERTAAWIAPLGCVLDPTPALVQAARAITAATPPAGEAAPRAPAAPTTAGEPPWPVAPTPPALARLLDAAFVQEADPQGPNTRAVLVLHRGRLVAERHARGFGPDVPQLGWSMAKTVISLLVHDELRREGRPATTPAIDWVPAQRRPAWLQAWQHDDRRHLTLQDLLFMRDGLDHAEGYAPWSAVPRMLWAETDVAAWAGAAPSKTAPGRHWRYASATTNVLSGLLRARIGDDAAYWTLAGRRLFGPLGLRGAVFEADPAGTLVGSSFLWATPRDWARIGELIRNDGRDAGRQLVAPGWLDWATRPPAPGSGDDAAMAYGAHVWLLGHPHGGGCAPERRPPADTIALTGHWGQFVAIVPSREVVIVRLGWTTAAGRFDRCAFIRDVVAALA